MTTNLIDKTQQQRHANESFHYQMAAQTYRRHQQQFQSVGELRGWRDDGLAEVALMDGGRVLGEFISSRAVGVGQQVAVSRPLGSVYARFKG